MKKEVITKVEEKEVASTLSPKMEIIKPISLEVASTEERRLCRDIEADLDTVLETVAAGKINNSSDAHTALESFVLKAFIESTKKNLHLVDSSIDLMYEDADGNRHGASFGLRLATTNNQ